MEIAAFSISIISIIINIILVIRELLLDKEYCEFVISEQKYGPVPIRGTYLFAPNPDEDETRHEERKRKYTQYLYLSITLIKSHANNIKIFTFSNNKWELHEKEINTWEVNTTKEFTIYVKGIDKIKIEYKDTKENTFEQFLNRTARGPFKTSRRKLNWTKSLQKYCN